MMNLINKFLIRHSKSVPLKALFIFILLIVCSTVFAQQPISVSKGAFPLEIGKQIEVLLDTFNMYNSSNIVFQNSFKQNNKSVAVFIRSGNNVWIRFSAKNLGVDPDLFLSVKYSNISNLWLYEKDSLNKLHLLTHTGNSQNFYSREDRNVDFNFHLFIPKGDEKNYYLNIKSAHPLELPLVLNSYDTLNENSFEQNLIIGIYCGIIISILLYNLFLFFATKDRSYLIYVAYLLFLGIAQITFSGWAFKFFWPSYPTINSFIVVCTSSLAGITGIAFAKSFLNTGYYSPRLNKFLTFLVFLYCIAIILSFTSFSFMGYAILNYGSLIGGITLLYLSIIIFRKGYRPAYFYFLAWSFFLLAIIIFVLRNLSILPTNNFTRSVLYFGSAIEAILLSIALADRINQLRKEKDLSQAEALRVSGENQQLITEQNIMLEQKVTERTEELQLTNSQLNNALDNLKDAQTQLVEAEKMASLGQLTAGIAHEINNPINFVKSNIKPLRLDINDLFEVINNYSKLHLADSQTIPKQLQQMEEMKTQMDLGFIKTEINHLIKGIEDGAERTAEIVRGLRTFSRLDESELKTVNIHEGIDSTIVLLRNSSPHYIEIIRDYKANGNIECYPGKINQVFMNIINNGLQAIKGKAERGEKETIFINTFDTDNNIIKISIRDSGIGMTEEVKHKIFEPFFTTKDVGEGTGLGMAIVFKIIEEHKGKIEVISEPGKGAEFILTLPYIHPID